MSCASAPSLSIARRTSLLAVAAVTLAIPAASQTAGTYAVTNLFSDGSVPATTTDAHFINPWGMSNSSTVWISTQGSGLNYVVSTAGALNFTVTIPAATGGTTATGTPTGSVTTASAPTGYILPNGTKASFLFCSLDGIITGWNNKLGTAGAVTQVVINNNAAGAVYTDIALMTNSNGTYLLAANFGKGSDVEVYDSTFAPAKLAGSFTDPSLPTGYVPYSVHAIGSQVFITYALRSTTATAPVIAPGNGIVNVFDTNGNLVAHAIAAGGNLNAPWGVAVAPTTFGPFGGALLVGNFGDGIINAYDPKSYAYLGQLTDGTGKTLTYASLWELNFGVATATANTLFFAAGLASEQHGLFAAITPNATASGTPTYGFSASASALTVTDGSSATFTISAIPTNNFSGTVALACTAQPQASTCTFSPAQLSVTSGAPATSTVTVTTVKKMADDGHPGKQRRAATEAITAALLLPFGAFLTLRRRSSTRNNAIKLVGLLGVLITTAAYIAGCSSTSAPFVPSTPTGASHVTISATSGTITQTTTVNLTVQ